jgi:hypothetical protein
MHPTPTRTDHIITYAQQKRLSPHTLARWRAWPDTDQAALWDFAHELQLGENHLRDFLDWCEETVLRDGGTVAELLTRPDLRRLLEAKLGRNDKLKAVKDALRKIRYPRLSRLEEDLRAAVKALDLGGRIQVSFPPALEGEEITVTIKARKVQELRDELELLRRRVEDGAVQRLFDLLEQV